MQGRLQNRFFFDQIAKFNIALKNEEWKNTAVGACSSVGRALAWHVRGRRFDPDQVHQCFNSVSQSIS